MGSTMQSYGRSQLRLNRRLCADLERLGGGTREPAMTESQFQELLEGDVTTLRRRLKALAKSNRSMQREVNVLDATHRQDQARRFAEGKGLNPRLTELFVSRAGEDPEGFWREHGELLLSLNHN